MINPYDLVNLVIGFVFSISLVPTILNRNAFIPRKTSILTAVGLTVMVYSLFHLQVNLTSVGTALTAACWWVIFIFKGKPK
jgi:hypothetical protein